MHFRQGTARRLRANGFEPEAVRVLIEHIESALPHLHFSAWGSRREVDPEPSGAATWKSQDLKKVGVHLGGEKVRLIASCKRDQKAVSYSDYRFLNALAREGAQMLIAARTGAFSMVDFGSNAVAEQLRGSLDLEFDPLPVLRFVGALGQETYENQRLAYGLILTSSNEGGAPFSLAFDNKRFKRVTDGFSTALVLDRHARVQELVPLTTPTDEGTARRRRPWWVAGLADAAKDREGAALALTRNGDLLVLIKGRLAFSARAGRWRKWDHAAILGRLKNLWDFRGAPQQVQTVLHYFYHVALDLSFRRSGGLLVVAGSEKRLKKLLPSKSDHIDSRRRKEPEKSLDSSVASRSIFRSDRRIVSDIASLDGAVVVDRAGRLIAYGAMTKSSRSAEQGARTRAAQAASREGVAIKVSSDGDISFFRGGKCQFKS